MVSQFFYGACLGASCACLVLEVNHTIRAKRAAKMQQYSNMIIFIQGALFGSVFAPTLMRLFNDIRGSSNTRIMSLFTDLKAAVFNNRIHLP
jgi:hypothetical protein